MVSPVVVCHQLRSPESLASIARSMANFGFTELILSDPQTHEFRAAGRMAVKADSVMEEFSVALTLDEALKGVVYAVGTTSRTQLKRFTALTPEQRGALFAPDGVLNDSNAAAKQQAEIQKQQASGQGIHDV